MLGERKKFDQKNVSKKFTQKLCFDLKLAEFRQFLYVVLISCYMSINVVVTQHEKSEIRGNKGEALDGVFRVLKSWS